MTRPPDPVRNRRLDLSAGVASVTVASVLILLKLWALAQTGSLSVATALALAASGLWGFVRIDAVVALLGAALMVFGALHVLKAAFDALMDRRADPAMIERIGAIANSFPGVLGWHDLRTRVSGRQLFVNLHVELDGRQSLDEAHAVCAALRRAIIAALPQADVMIHADPVGVTRHPDDPRSQ